MTRNQNNWCVYLFFFLYTDLKIWELKILKNQIIILFKKITFFQSIKIITFIKRKSHHFLSQKLKIDKLKTPNINKRKTAENGARLTTCTCCFVKPHPIDDDAWKVEKKKSAPDFAPSMECREQWCVFPPCAAAVNNNVFPRRVADNWFHMDWLRRRSNEKTVYAPKT